MTQEYPYDYLIVHCTATPPNLDVDDKWVDRAHRRRGFQNGTGYNGIIKRDGTLLTAEGGFKCRPFGVAGAHVGDCGPGWNRRALGLSLAGGVDAKNNPENNFTDAQWVTLEETIEAWADRFDIPLENIIGHRDLIKMTSAPPKACPCFSVKEWMTQSLRDGPKVDPAVPSSGQRSGLFFEFLEEFADGLMGFGATHTVKAGETLWSISRTYGHPLAQLFEMNPGLSANNLAVGQVIKLR